MLVDLWQVQSGFRAFQREHCRTVAGSRKFVGNGQDEVRKVVWGGAGKREEMGVQK